MAFRKTCGKCGAVRIDSQIGLESTPDAYVAELVAVFREVRRVLRDDGLLFLNLGDSYCSTDKWGGGVGGNTGKHTVASNGSVPSWSVRQRKSAMEGIKPKDLIGIPWMVAFALRADGWWLRSDIIWAKPNPMPESVTDRPTSAHEHVFLLTKAARYFWDAEAVREEATPQERMGRKGYECPSDVAKRANGDWHQGSQTSGLNGPSGTSRNCRNVWTIATQPFSGWQDSVDLVPVPSSEVPELAASGNAIGDDISRITSPDCPLHGGRPDRVPKGFCDGLSVDQLTRIRGNGGGRVPGKTSGSGATPRTRDHSHSLLSNSDCLPHADAATATRNNIESHKTGRDPASCERAIFSEENVSDTQRTAQLPSVPASTDHDTGGNRTWEDSSPSRCEPQTAGGSSGTSESDEACCCGYYRKVVTKTAHFATFPPALAERCIKAGSKPGDTVLDPFSGAGTTCLVADRLGRDGVGIELNPAYSAMAHSRVVDDCPLFAEVVGA